jgi:hypothetical protein
MSVFVTGVAVTGTGVGGGKCYTGSIEIKTISQKV